MAHESGKPTVIPLDELHLCPVCRKLFVQEKAMYHHILRVHRDREYLSYNLRAGLYERWQERLPRGKH